MAPQEHHRGAVVGDPQGGQVASVVVAEARQPDGPEVGGHRGVDVAAPLLVLDPRDPVGGFGGHQLDGIARAEDILDREPLGAGQGEGGRAREARRATIARSDRRFIGFGSGKLGREGSDRGGPSLLEDAVGGGRRATVPQPRAGFSGRSEYDILKS